MNRAIAGFGQDDHGDWFARLDCGHRQHMRHNPPFTQRAWVATEEGRARMIGEELPCPLCIRLETPDGLEAYKATPEFTPVTVPAGLLRDHSTRAGTWGRIEVLEGTVTYVTGPPSSVTIEIGAGEDAMIPPQLPHHVILSEEARFRVVFLRLSG